MAVLLLSFSVWLRDDESSSFFPRHGPIFHRWLPDGEKDAIVLETEDASTRLRVWFERRGYKKGDFITFDLKRQEIDPEFIPRQAALSAGPLKGLLEIQGCSPEEMSVLQGNKIGDDVYVALGKRVVKHLIYPSVSRLLNVLRVNYGQYWIRELAEWDSRTRSLGGYCEHLLNMKWSLDGGETWSEFVPNMPTGSEHVVLHLIHWFSEYLTEADWQDLQRVAKSDYQLSPAALALARAHELCAQGQLRQALVEGVTATEIAIKEFVRRKLESTPDLVEAAQAIYKMPLQAQLICLVVQLEPVPLGHLRCAVGAIEARHDLVHEGKEPSSDIELKIRSLLKMTAALLPGPTYKFPIADMGNAVNSIEEWEKDLQSSD